MDFAPPCGIFCVKAALSSQLIHLGIWNVCASPRPIFAVKKIFFAIIVLEIEQIGHIEILMHLLPKFP